MLDKDEYFSCECGSDEHTLRFILDLDEQPPMHSSGEPYPRYPELYASAFLSHYQSWYKRLWGGIKYIFGYKCKYGHFDSFIMQEEDVDRMVIMLKQFQVAKQEVRDEQISKIIKSNAKPE